MIAVNKNGCCTDSEYEKDGNEKSGFDRSGYLT